MKHEPNRVTRRRCRRDMGDNGCSKVKTSRQSSFESLRRAIRFDWLWFMELNELSRFNYGRFALNLSISRVIDFSLFTQSSFAVWEYKYFNIHEYSYVKLNILKQQNKEQFEFLLPTSCAACQQFLAKSRKISFKAMEIRSSNIRIFLCNIPRLNSRTIFPHWTRDSW